MMTQMQEGWDVILYSCMAISLINKNILCKTAFVFYLHALQQQ